ncbi:MAG TPA: hypothetical protein VGM88_27220 [Kofleriaceae bacterium]|jgi:hypothetical protein
MEDAPALVREYADQAVAYVKRTLGVALEYDSDTLPLLDHYLRDADITAGGDEGKSATMQLVIATAGAYFGETVRRVLGGRWELPGASPDDPDRDAVWRVILPTGLSFAPAGMVATAIAQADLPHVDSELDAPIRMRPYVQRALERMGEITVEEYYSLCGRLDTIEHIHEVLVAVAAQLLGDAGDPDDLDPTDEPLLADPDADPEPTPEPDDPIADDPSGPVN